MKKWIALVLIICSVVCLLCTANADIIPGTPRITDSGNGASNTYFVTAILGKKSGYYAHVLCTIQGFYVTNGMTTSYSTYGSGSNCSANLGEPVPCTARCYPHSSDDYRTGSYSTTCRGYWQN